MAWPPACISHPPWALFCTSGSPHYSVPGGKLTPCGTSSGHTTIFGVLKPGRGCNRAYRLPRAHNVSLTTLCAHRSTLAPSPQQTSLSEGLRLCKHPPSVLSLGSETVGMGRGGGGHGSQGLYTPNLGVPPTPLTSYPKLVKQNITRDGSYPSTGHPGQVSSHILAAPFCL